MAARRRAAPRRSPTRSTGGRRSGGGSGVHVNPEVVSELVGIAFLVVGIVTLIALLLPGQGPADGSLAEPDRPVVRDGTLAPAADPDPGRPVHRAGPGRRRALGPGRVRGDPGLRRPARRDRWAEHRQRWPDRPVRGRRHGWPDHPSRLVRRVRGPRRDRASARARHVPAHSASAAWPRGPDRRPGPDGAGRRRGRSDGGRFGPAGQARGSRGGRRSPGHGRSGRSR